ncbi:MAG TPA: zinc-binding alcohol dehydrogenase family protein [Streptosporangiaceae bacterium]|nr:zinc-binding alcohol dehydrogenase family protein [Streptosporangiaceae bacterium]
MKAAVLTEFGSPLELTTLPDLVLGTGEIIVDVVAAHVLSYTGEVLRGERNYALELPLAPGTAAVGRVRATGPDSTRLRPGDWVLCDITVRSRDDLQAPDIVLQGWSARGPGGRQLMRHYRHGAFASQMMIPTENAIPLGPIDEAAAGRWCALDLLLVPYGGLTAVDLQAGETVLVSGATGNYGSAGVAVALAMGAARVVAPGRNQAVLDDLARRYWDRVRTTRLTGDPGEDQRRMRAAADGPIDVVLDLLPPAAGTAPVRAAALTVREFGRVVLMGGVGMLGGDDLALPYPWLMRNGITVRGQWMFPRAAAPRLISLARSGLLDLGQYRVTEFSLDDVNQAVDHAAGDKPFALTVVRP